MLTPMLEQFHMNNGDKFSNNLAHNWILLYGTQGRNLLYSLQCCHGGAVDTSHVICFK